MNIWSSMDRRSAARVVDLETNEPAADGTIVLYEEDAAEKVVDERLDGTPQPREVRMDVRDAMLALHDLAVWRR